MSSTPTSQLWDTKLSWVLVAIGTSVALVLAITEDMMGFLHSLPLGSALGGVDGAVATISVILFRRFLK